MANANCDISNDITEPILNPALDPSDCFISTDRMYTRNTCGDVVGNISTTFYASNSDLLDDVQTNLLISRLNNTSTRPLCEQARRPVFRTYKEQLQYMKYYRERGYIASLGLSTAYFESITNSKNG